MSEGEIPGGEALSRVRLAKDEQRLKNIQLSELAEAAALSSTEKEPIFIIDKTARIDILRKVEILFAAIAIPFLIVPLLGVPVTLACFAVSLFIQDFSWVWGLKSGGLSVISLLIGLFFAALCKAIRQEMD